MLRLRGRQAVSDFRISKLLTEIQQACPSVTAISSEYQHLIKLHAQTDADALLQDKGQIIESLLEYGPKMPKAPHDGQLLFIVPRLGTISPWSSKATDIAHHCQLSEIERIERGTAWYIQSSQVLSEDNLAAVAACLHDPMTESVLLDFEQAQQLFRSAMPQPLTTVPLLEGGRLALESANTELGLALSADEINYLLDYYQQAQKDPTDVELMMFAQVNSEHCRHKIFNADWVIDGEKRSQSLFGMIRETHKQNPQGTLVAYSDNSSVLAGSKAQRFVVDPDTRQYRGEDENIHILCKVETHNHPTAISPFPGAATGSGGEIRDEGATGRGSKPKAGLTGFSVSDLRLPDLPQPWETDLQKPERIVSPLQIMLEGPIGGAAFNNEFGRPNIAGYFRTYEQAIANADDVRGYHKPIMLAGGLGNIREQHIEKQIIPDGAYIIVLGGPAMLIGLGGGAASSVSSGSSSQELDFASVQRGNPEMQRRCQEVIDACWSKGEDNPIISIHDIGAGGLCNALPELVGDAGKGGKFDLRKVLNDEPAMTPMQIWCNEAQERYTLAVSAERLAEFEAICARERCLYCVVGQASDDQLLVLNDSHFSDGNERQQTPIDMPMSVLLGKPPKMTRDVDSAERSAPPLALSEIDFKEALQRVLSLPTVADKTFLISIADRSVTGMIARDQMVGPWQVPVADVAVTTSSYKGVSGEAMAIGERTPIASVNAPASGRMAIGEALTNIGASAVRDLSEVKLSANWMAAAGHPGDDAALYETVKAVGLELCPQLGIAIPVGKDSMSMKTVWQNSNGQPQSVTAPVSCVISAFAPVDNVDLTLTPELDLTTPSEIVLIDLAKGQRRLACSALAQVYNQVGTQTPDVEDAHILKSAFGVIQKLLKDQHLLAYHDRSDGGLIVALLEMAFASRCGLDIFIDSEETLLESCFNEELGVLVQVAEEAMPHVRAAFAEAGLSECLHTVAKPKAGDDIALFAGEQRLHSFTRMELHRIWSQTTYQMQRLRDNPECAQQEYDRILDSDDCGLFANTSFDVREDITAPYIARDVKPKMAILREQGVNGQLEMAAAFTQAGFDAIDVTMTDLISGQQVLDDFHGLVACGGFSYGDVLGAGEGWAKSILFNQALKDQFERYFARQDAFSLGICNGCQMMSNLKSIIPGADAWPHFVKNKSEQFEARLVQVQIAHSPSILLNDMAGSQIPVVVAHGEGRAEFRDDQHLQQAQNDVVLQYIDSHGELAQNYPLNPNGSPMGIAGLTSADGRATIMMPHPERIFRSCTHSWRDKSWGEYGPWMRMFRNARLWLD